MHHINRHFLRFLRGMTWVDFRKQEPDPMGQLIWSITGRKADIDNLYHIANIRLHYLPIT
jgi:hypothetical protein